MRPHKSIIGCVRRPVGWSVGWSVTHSLENQNLAFFSTLKWFQPDKSSIHIVIHPLNHLF